MEPLDLLMPASFASEGCVATASSTGDMVGRGPVGAETWAGMEDCGPVRVRSSTKMCFNDLAKMFDFSNVGKKTAGRPYMSLSGLCVRRVTGLKSLTGT